MHDYNHTKCSQGKMNVCMEQCSVYVNVNHQCVCVARVTLVGSVCVSHCLSVRLSWNFCKVYNQRTMEVKIFVGFSLKLLHSSDPALLPLKTIHTVGHFLRKAAHAHIPRVMLRALHFSALILPWRNTPLLYYSGVGVIYVISPVK